MTQVVVPRSGSGRGHVRTLGPEDRGALHALCLRSPHANLFVRQRLEQRTLGRPWLGAQWWGYEEAGRLVSACHVGANVVPVEATPDAARAFADLLTREPARQGSIVGPEAAVLAMWEVLEPVWGPARSVRPGQPFLTIERDSLVPPDPRVRLVQAHELEALYPAAVSMFTEEVGVDPDPTRTGGYRARVRELIALGHAYAIIEHGEVVFKTDVGAAMPDVVQLQGVWVHPRWRGTGLAAPALSAVVRDARARLAPVVTLYVNDYNEVARRAYARVGFTQTDTFATILT